MPSKNKEKLRTYAEEYRKEHREAIRIKGKEYYYKNREKRLKEHRDNPEKIMFMNAKRRAKLKGIEFNITLEDVIITPYCPIFGVPIFVSKTGKPTPNSPSLDRVDISKGYIKGNVVVISHRANQIKNDGTADEHIRIASFMRSFGYDL